MKPAVAVRATLLSVIIALSLAGCGSDDSDMTQKDIQHLSHLDQSRFFQRQGELKASTQEARSAIELKPDNLEPYFLIIDNLLTAGDAVNAERQLNRLMERMSEKDISPTLQNRANLILAEANLKQGKFDDALTALAKLTSPEDDIEVEALLLKGQIFLGTGEVAKAKQAYETAHSSDPGSVDALIGLSKVALTSGNEDRSGELVAEAEEIDKENAELWLWKAQKAHLNEDWQKAEDAYIRALEDIGQYDVMTARKYTTISALIRVLRAQSKFSEAYVYEEILAKSPPGKIRSNLIAADDALKKGNLAQAESYLQEVLAQAPNHEQSVLMLGLIRFRQGRAEEAQELLAPIAQTGNSEIASKMLAATMLQMGNPEGAQTTLAELKNGDSDPEILTLVAIAALENGDVETGEALMEKALGINPDNYELRLRYAGYLNQRGEHERAIRQAELVREAAPDLDQARSIIIQAHLGSGNREAAVQTADDWIKTRPESVSALITRGNLAVNAGDLEAARTYFMDARAKAPQSAAPLIALGKLALVQNNRTEAQNQFQNAVQLAPDSAQALQGIISLQDRGETQQFMQQILEQSPDATGPRLILLEIALLDNDSETANDLTASLLERAEENTPSPASHLVADIYNNVVSNLKSSGDDERATSVLERARVLFPTNEQITLQAARQAFDKGHSEEAMAILSEAKDQHPNSPRPYLTEAEYRESEAKYQEAAQLYREAISKASNAEIVTGYVRNLQRSGRINDALAYLESELASTPNNTKLRLNLALLQQSSGKDNSAMSNYEVLLESMPDNTVVLNNLAWLYHKTGDERAVPLAERAYELSPENAAIADTYGWIMLKSGNHRESVPVLEKAHELQPDSEEIARHLAEAYRVVGMNSAAQRILKKFGEQG
ncbi:tetratricopeptide repeat protein [Marinobacter sp. F4206]|uniref:tetratricopeptide repeat protein n=1 Tax=Marinobacter sp. F4206 TaxID=2861777 RepID=UPI001C5EF42F|nr:tetratricopeptide repeat protein [Marinobacter sp. F4206]MBW4933385.1 tetratricopeptide repeat protein [Marinobacter sp. F4206]